MLSPFPPEWDEIKSVIEKANKRPIDTAELASLINEMTAITPRCVMEGKLRAQTKPPGKFDQQSYLSRLHTALGLRQKSLDQFDEQYLARWCAALGMRKEDLAAQKKAQRLSSFILQTAKMPALLLQYAVIPAISKTTGDPYDALYASAVLAVANVFINTVTYPLLTATSVHVQARGGPSVNLDKNVNYKHRPKIEAAETARQSAALQEQNTLLLQRLLQEDIKPAFEARYGEGSHTLDNVRKAIAKPQELGHDLLLVLKDTLPAAELQALYRQGMKLIAQAEKLAITGDNVDRQVEGGKHRFWLGVSRPMLAALPPLFAHGSHRAGWLSPAQVYWTSIAIVLAGLVVQYLFLAPWDQQSKGEAKHKLNILHADIYNDSGQQKIATGAELGPDDFDEKKVRALVATPAKVMLTKAINIARKEINQLTPQELEKLTPAAREKLKEEQEKLEEAHRVWTKEQESVLQGNWKAIEDAPHVIKKVSDAAGKFSGGGIWQAGVKSNYTRSEMTDEMIRSISKSFHFGIFGSVASNFVPRLSSALSGGTSHVPLPAYIGVLAFSLLSAYLAASSDGVITTYTNIRKKEDKAQQPALWIDIGRGMTAFVNMHLESRQSTQALKSAFAELEHGPFVLALHLLHPPAPAEDGTVSSQDRIDAA
ncbi:hypothetical protein GJA_2506 [Janthinobacterium agaricidamnosum NBRC 102515 = DSM 9628]|uniref:Uncharacterized protein n=1 Tax=Janthinobacterium agaricidamnosum NBRC 102515 = DSM 9628 TaxID=1349767 RepID=W0V792_9BURK|nr:hypothetical protein GJA_2506 [Janthinobacterium agaricidamnosum NBRC 102515 = DSM 9628]